MTNKNMVKKEDFLITNLKGLLQEKVWLLNSRMHAKRSTTPYANLTEAEMRVLATLRGEELTISEVARRLNVSRQAVHKIIAKLVDKKILQLESFEVNSRDKRITFTHTGEAMKKEAAKVLKEIEQEIQDKIGIRNLALLKSLLAKEW